MSITPPMSRRLALAADAFDPRGLPLAIARSVIAVATLSVLLFSSLRTLLVVKVYAPQGVTCVGSRSLSLWCIGGTAPTAQNLERALSVLVLVAAASGYRPRWTCIPHWYITFSIAASFSLPNGGDLAASVVTLLFIPLCLGDPRTWQWRQVRTKLMPPWGGVSYAGHLMLRLQVVIIYLVAGGSKLLSAGWRDGSALNTTIYDPYFGFAPAVRRVLAPVLGQRNLVEVGDWLVIAMELSIAGLILLPAARRRLGVGIAVVLHGGIVIFMGLPTFGVIMIAIVLAAACTGVRPRSAGTGIVPDSLYNTEAESARPQRERDHEYVG